MKQTIPKLKKKLDTVFSKYIRYSYSEDGEHVACYTCGIVKPIKEMHNGHYIPRTQSPTRYHESNCRPQCPGCNSFRSGMPHVFRENLCIEIGAYAVEQMEEESKQPHKWDRGWLESQIEYYKHENKLLGTH